MAQGNLPKDLRCAAYVALAAPAAYLALAAPAAYLAAMALAGSPRWRSWHRHVTLVIIFLLVIVLHERRQLSLHLALSLLQAVQATVGRFHAKSVVIFGLSSSFFFVVIFLQ